MKIISNILIWSLFIQSRLYLFWCFRREQLQLVHRHRVEQILRLWISLSVVNIDHVSMICELWGINTNIWIRVIVISKFVKQPKFKNIAESSEKFLYHLFRYLHFIDKTMEWLINWLYFKYVKLFKAACTREYLELSVSRAAAAALPSNSF